MEATKIQFSGAEIELLSNAEIILTKNNALTKMRLLLEAVHQSQTGLAAQWQLTAPDLFKTPGKISRGENYLGLPYLVLDYPRNFGVTGIFALRSFFWWGRFFSVTLHLSGSFVNYRSALEKQYGLLKQSGCYLGVNPDPWQHHFEPHNYQPVSGMTEAFYETHLYSLPHTKIAAKWPLDEWPFAATKFLNNWRLFLEATGLIA